METKLNFVFLFPLLFFFGPSIFTSPWHETVLSVFASYFLGYSNDYLSTRQHRKFLNLLQVTCQYIFWNLAVCCPEAESPYFQVLGIGFCLSAHIDLDQTGGSPEISPAPTVPASPENCYRSSQAVPDPVPFSFYNILFCALSVLL